MSFIRSIRATFNCLFFQPRNPFLGFFLTEFKQAKLLVLIVLNLLGGVRLVAEEEGKMLALKVSVSSEDGRFLVEIEIQGLEAFPLDLCEGLPTSMTVELWHGWIGGRFEHKALAFPLIAPIWRRRSP